jgi:16S rRNA (cytosine1402-N4)-methyltransferase
MPSIHKSVLLKESIDALSLSSGKVFIDGTFGGGGHSREVRERFGDKIQIIGLDRDPQVKAANPDFDVRTTSFADINELGTQTDAILLDLGISSDQIDASGRGFTFQKDEPLDMRMSASGITAAEILNSWDEGAIELILRGFGEEKYSRRIAKEIIRTRDLRPFRTTQDLVETIESVVPAPYRHGRIHPATRTFQALRIAVNEELTALEKGLEKGFEILNPGGRLAVITFHSLEDRIVKNFFRDKAKEERGKLINKKPIGPTEEEILSNPRSRSAKLRVIEKI